MGKLILAHDWSKTSLGPVSSWPQSLLTALSLILPSPFAARLFWGPELVCLYNDAYAALCGSKHPQLLGLPVEAWEQLNEASTKDRAMVRNGGFVMHQDRLMMVERTGNLEEAYFTTSLSPIRGEDGEIVGMFNFTKETTKRVMNEMRLSTLRDLDTKTLTKAELKGALRSISEVFNQRSNTFPFTLLYLLDRETNNLTLRINTGFSTDAQKLDQLPKTIPFSSDLLPSAHDRMTAFAHLLKKSMQEKYTIVIENLQQQFGPFPGGQWPESPRHALILPLSSAEQDMARGVIVIGVNPRRPLDDDYKSFLEQVADQATRIIATTEANEADKRRLEMLVEIDRAKTLFFSNVSHEFRTPLTLMLGPLEDSLEDLTFPLNGIQKERQTLIFRNTLRLLKLVNSLLDFSRIEMNRMHTIYEPINLSNLTIDLASMFRSAIEKAGLEFAVEVSDLGQPIYIDKEMYEKIIFNLLSNAFKFTLKGKITVKLRKLEEEDKVELTVQDTGVGIEKHNLSHIFERFYRVENSQGRSYEGSGIGLALVADLVKLQHGTICVESELHQGSIFRVTFPLGRSHLQADQIGTRESHQSGKIGIAYVEEALHWLHNTSPSKNEDSTSVVTTEPSQREIEVPNQNTSNFRVLVVDDNSDMRSYLKSLITPSWGVSTASDGEEALAAVLANPPDLILSDMMMPKMDGPQLVRELRDRPSTKLIPIILLSARAGEEARIQGLHTGADDYVVKPFSSKELLARIQLHLELGRLRMDLDHLTTMAPVGIFQSNEHGHCTYFNSTFTTITGLSREALKVHTWIDYIHPEDQKEILQKWRSAKQTKTKFQAEFRFLRPDSHVAWVFAQIVQNNTGGYIGVFDDLTETKQLQEAKMLALQKAEESQRLRAEEAEAFRKMQIDFIDTICHEIRNPLNGIDGSLNIVKEHIQEIQEMVVQCEELRQTTSLHQKLSTIVAFLTDALECTEYQTVILNDVLNLSKLEAKKLILEYTPFDLKEIIYAVARMFSGSLQQKSLTLTFQLPAQTIITKGDPNRLKQVLINFLSNATKFTQVGGITISLTVLQANDQTKDHFQIAIQDTGQGMNEEERQHLFEPYWQGKTAYKGKGTGLGLPISKRLIELMGGTIQVQSEKGKGTTFSFTIVCAALSIEELEAFMAGTKAVAHPAVNAISAMPTPISMPLRILIVEDNQVNKRILLNALKKHGFECTTADNGKDGVKHSLEMPFDVILMDIEMPLLNGFEATLQIRQHEIEANRPPIPIICLSGNAREEHKEKALAVGMSDFISKPYKTDVLLDKIERLTKNRVSVSAPSPSPSPLSSAPSSSHVPTPTKRTFSSALGSTDDEGPPKKK